MALSLPMLADSDLFTLVVFMFFAILSGVAVISLRNPIKSAVALVVSFFSLSAIYALLGAHFVEIDTVRPLQRFFSVILVGVGLGQTGNNLFFQVKNAAAMRSAHGNDLF